MSAGQLRVGRDIRGVMSRASATRRNATAVPPAQPADHQTHVGQLSGLNEDELARLLALRPDLAAPAPASLADLEERSLSLPSAYHAIRGADLRVLQLAQVFTLIGEKHASLDALRAMVGDVPEPDLQSGLDWLVERNLLTRLPHSQLCVHVGLLSIRGAGALGPPARGLVEGRSVNDLRAILKKIGRTTRATRKADLAGEVVAFVTDPTAVCALLDQAPDDVRDYALLVASGSVARLPWGASYSAHPAGLSAQDRLPAVWLFQRGLVYRDDWSTAVMPLEVGLALRGGRPFPSESFRRPTVPSLPLTPPPPFAAEERVAALDQAVERLIDSWGQRPASLLKNEGIGTREVKRLAAATELAERDTFRLIEMAAAAGLIVGDSKRRVALPTAAGDEWLDLPAADRWWALAHSWLETSMYPSLAGALDSRNKVIPALGYGRHFDSQAAGQRRGVLRALLGLPPGTGTDEESLAELAAWDAPMLWHEVPGSPTTMVKWTLAEMEFLGLAVGGAPTALAAALLDGDVQGARDLLGAGEGATWQLVLQADLTALVTGRPPSSVRAELEVLADAESRGSATVYRISEHSLRRAFDAGYGSRTILDFLDLHAAKGVPQPLAYLVEDVERRHGQVRLGRAGCYLRFEDPALAAQVLRAKKTAKLGLRQIAPTVLVCDQTNAAVLEAVRAAGYLPVVEASDGSVVHAPVNRHRAESPPARSEPGRRSTAGPEVRTDGAADRWRAQLAADGSEPRPSEHRALAAALRRTVGQTGGRPSAPGRDGIVELPTVLRRPPPTSGAGTAGLDAEIERLAELIAAGDGLSDEDIDLLRDVLEPGLSGDDGFDEYEDEAGRVRPTEIVRGPGEITALLEVAAEEDWMVRLSYTSAAGKTSEGTATVVAVLGAVALVQVAPKWTDRKYIVDRIAWARVLTEAEEEALS